MRKTIQLCDDLALPLDIVTMRTATYGDSGAGKTTFGRLLGEKVHEAGQRFCAIDLKNDWWGFKSSADGSAAGLPVVIFGGPRGDVKLIPDDAAARALAETVASIDQSVILDLDAMSRAKQERFLAAFLDAFYEVNRRPLLLFCDEADRYAPQKPMTQDAIQSLSSSEDIARRGRKRGIGSLWLTQRTAVLNKNVSEFCNLTVIFRTPGSRDLAELEERVGRIATKETVKEVVRLAPGLADGQAFFLSSHPKLRPYMPDPVRPIQLPMPWTFDSSATPGVGQRRREPKVLAQTDLAAIEHRMASVVTQAKANDPKELRAELVKAKAELQKLKGAPTPTPQVKTKTVERFVLKDGQLERADKLIGRLADAFTKAGELQAAVKAITDELAAAIKLTRQPTPAPQPAIIPSRAPVIPQPAPVISRPPIAHSPANGDAGKLGKCERAILAVLSQYPEGCLAGKLTLLSGYRWTGSFRNGLSVLRTAGYIEGGNDDTMKITAEGLAQGPFDPLPRGEKFVQYWLTNAHFGKCERDVLGVLVDHPEGQTAEQLTAATGYQWTGSFRNALSVLRTAGVLVGKNAETMRASDELLEAQHEAQTAGR